MTPERFQKAKELFLQAAELTSADRRDFLKKTCGGDVELLAAVEGFLANAPARPLEPVANNLKKMLYLHEDDESTASVMPSIANAGWAAGHSPLPGYRLIRCVGRGGIGEVWEAFAPGEIPIALKRVELGHGCGETEHAALDLLKRVRHPHLVSTHAYWIHRNELIIAFELADRSLDDLLKGEEGDDRKGLTSSAVIRYLSDAAEALDFLNRPIHNINSHAVSIRHCDIKPSNLLLMGDALKVADCGLAQAVRNVLTSYHGGLTAWYAPPEFEHNQVAPSSDQYSLGVTYCELRTGKRPFSGGFKEVRHAHLHLPPDLSGLLEPERFVVARALNKSPEKRWAGCVKFIGEAQRALRPLEINGAPIPKDDWDESPSSFRRFHGMQIQGASLFAAEGLAPLPVVRVDVRAGITAAIADVTLTHTFINTHNRTVGAVYVFPLPDRAAVRRIRMYIGDQIVEGRIRELHEARGMFQQAAAEGHGAALLETLEEDDSGLFSTSVANILPGQQVRIELAYLEPLSCRDGQYRFVFPMRTAPDHSLTMDSLSKVAIRSMPSPLLISSASYYGLHPASITVDIDLDAGVPLCAFDSPSHDINIIEETGKTRVHIAFKSAAAEIPNCDFVLTYRVAGSEITHALIYEPGKNSEWGTFLLMVALPARTEPLATAEESENLVGCPQRVLTHIKLEWEGDAVDGILPDPLPDVSRDNPLVLIGRCRTENPPPMRLNGLLAGQPWQAKITPDQARRHVGGVPLELLWVHMRLESLEQRARQHPFEAADLRESIVRESIKYQLIGPYTGCVAIDYRSPSERMVSQMGVDANIPNPDLSELMQRLETTTRSLSANLNTAEPDAKRDTKLSESPELAQAADTLIARIEQDSKERIFELDADTPEDPADVAGYQIVREINRGAQGIVYKAVQYSTGATVAVKVLKEAKLAGERARWRFKQEIRLLASLQHPNIVGIHDSGITHGQYYYSMDYVPGQPLDAYVRSATPGVRDTVRLFQQVCAAVGYAHDRGVIHRSLTPSCVLVDDKNEPHLVGFGLANRIGEPSDQPGFVVGVPSYMSPEQTLGQPDRVDTRADVYALGVMLYESIANERPYEVNRDDITSACKTIREVDPPRPSRSRRGVSSDLDAIILKAMEKQPERRYQSVGELRDDLSAWLDNRPVRARSASSLYLLRKMAVRHMVLFSLIAALIGSGKVAYYQYSRNAAAMQERFQEQTLGWFLLEWRDNRLERARAIAKQMKAGTPEAAAMAYLLDRDYPLDRLLSEVGTKKAIAYFAAGERALKEGNKQEEAFTAYERAMELKPSEWLRAAIYARLDQLRRNQTVS